MFLKFGKQHVFEDALLIKLEQICSVSSQLHTEPDTMVKLRGPRVVLACQCQCQCQCMCTKLHVTIITFVMCCGARSSITVLTGCPVWGLLPLGDPALDWLMHDHHDLCPQDHQSSFAVVTMHCTLHVSLCCMAYTASVTSCFFGSARACLQQRCVPPTQTLHKECELIVVQW